MLPFLQRSMSNPLHLSGLINHIKRNELQHEEIKLTIVISYQITDNMNMMRFLFENIVYPLDRFSYSNKLMTEAYRIQKTCCKDDAPFIILLALLIASNTEFIILRINLLHGLI